MFLPNDNDTTNLKMIFKYFSMRPHLIAVVLRFIFTIRGLIILNFDHENRPTRLMSGVSQRKVR